MNSQETARKTLKNSVKTYYKISKLKQWSWHIYK